MVKNQSECHFPIQRLAENVIYIIASKWVLLKTDPVG